MKRWMLGLAVAALFGAVAAKAAPTKWRLYQNPRFGVSAEVPADWSMGPEPANGDGRVFTSPDQNATITISGMYSISTPAEEIAQREMPDAGETMTYKASRGGMVTISGLRDGRIFYRKSLLACGVWNDLAIEYPGAEKTRYDGIVGHVAGSLKANRGQDGGACR